MALRGRFAADQSAWPSPSPGAPDFGGISEAFNNPLQTIRDDFGTLRLDHNFSHKDTLNAVYTIDDSADFTPTSTNLYSTDAETLREQVASVEETHVFSSNLLNTARVGFSRAGYFFTGEPTPGTPAASVARLSGRDSPSARSVVGGSAASNPTAQISLAGSNNGSNLESPGIYSRMRIACPSPRAAIRSLSESGSSVSRSNENLALSQYGQATFTSLQTLLQGTVATLLFDPAPTPLGWRSLVRRMVRRRHHAADSQVSRCLWASATSSPTDGMKPMAAPPPTPSPNGIISTQPTIGNSRLHGQQREIPAATARRIRLEPVPQQAHRP